MSDGIEKVIVLSVRQWTPSLFSFTVTRPSSFKFTAGQFVRLGMNPQGLAYFNAPNANRLDNNANALGDKEEDIFRAYSIVSSPYDEVLEFFSVVIPDGAFTSKLQYLQVNDELLLNTTPFGFLTLARYQQPIAQDLWLLATGTGVAPFLSMLQDIATWQDYEHIVLAYSVRTHSELAYHDKILELQTQFGALADKPAKLIYQPIITRERVAGALGQRLPKLLRDGGLESATGQTLNTDTSHVMLCGNPQMVEDTKETLKTMGLTMNRRGVGNIAVENYW